MQLNVFEDVIVLAQQQSTTIFATHYRRSDFTATKQTDVGTGICKPHVIHFYFRVVKHGIRGGLISICQKAFLSLSTTNGETVSTKIDICRFGSFIRRRKGDIKRLCVADCSF